MHIVVEYGEIKNMDELRSYILLCNDSSSLANILTELSTHLDKRDISLSAASELQNFIMGQLTVINNMMSAGGMSGGKRLSYVANGDHHSSTAISGKEGAINVWLLIISAIATAIMYILLTYASFIK